MNATAFLVQRSTLAPRSLASACWTAGSFRERRTQRCFQTKGCPSLCLRPVPSVVPHDNHGSTQQLYSQRPFSTCLTAHAPSAPRGEAVSNEVLRRDDKADGYTYTLHRTTYTQQHHALAWSSLWILVPFGMWVVQPELGIAHAEAAEIVVRQVPAPLALGLPLCTMASVMHWRNVVHGSLVHIADKAFATAICGGYSYVIGFEFGRPDVVAMLLGPLCIGYAFSLRYETPTGADNGKELVAHSTFRYFAFW